MSRDAVRGQQCDVAVIGGSAAGLAAALQLGRQRRHVVVIDAGEPRNAPSAHMHGYPGFDGASPSHLLAAARAEVASCGVQLLRARAVDVTGDAATGFTVEVDDGSSVDARRIIAATGLVDDLPVIEGIADHWGADVIHCPFCHGFEVRGERLVQILTHGAGLHQSVLFRQLTDQLTVVVHGSPIVERSALDDLERDGVRVKIGDVVRVVSDGLRVRGVELEDGTTLDAQRIVVGPRFRATVSAFETLGVTAERHPSGLGDHVVVDATGQTSVPGVYAAGNVTDPSHQVLHAAAAGSRVGATVASDLAHEDHRRRVAAAASDSTFDKDYWERHWRRAAPAEVSLAGVSPYMALELDGLSPATALDAGCGAGSEAVWLAQRGWRVTGVDISAEVVDLARARSEHLTVDNAVTWVQADLTEWEPPARYDLVVTSYAHPTIPHVDFYRRLQGWVAPGGTLLVVAHGHDHDGHGHGHNGDHHHPAPPPAATVTVDAVVAAISSDAWTIVSAYETSRTVERDAGRVQLRDVVVRATRQG